MNIDERLEALTMNLEHTHHEIQGITASILELKGVAQQDGENIRALARIAEIHERRLTDLEDQE